MPRPRRAATPDPEPPALTPRQASISDAVETMPATFVYCRDFGHAWRPWRTRWIDKERVYSSELRCTRCHTVRERLISASGGIVSSHYEYAEGYQIHGLGQLSSGDRDTIRLASMIHLSTPKIRAVESA